MDCGDLRQTNGLTPSLPFPWYLCSFADSLIHAFTRSHNAQSRTRLGSLSGTEVICDSVKMAVVLCRQARVCHSR